MEAVKRRWLDYWFASVGPERLALCRIGFYGALFLLYALSDLRPFGHLVAFWSPLPTFDLLGLPAPTVGGLAVAQVAWKVALLCCCVGFLTRPAAVVSFVLGFYLIGLPYNFGSLKHDDAITVLVLGVLALARTGDAYSVDRWLATRRKPGVPAAPSGEYRWPIGFVCLLIAWVFCAAGLSKLRLSGLEWIFSDSLAILLLQNQYHLTPADPLPVVGPLLARVGWLCQIMAAFTIVVEVSMPLALLGGWARRILLPCGVLLLIGFRVTLGPDFIRLIICMLFWVPWDTLLDRLVAWWQARVVHPGAAGSMPVGQLTQPPAN